ncbi:MAG: hypothetical protein JWO50_88 [Candidatus Kaiserbacteria bacterium]|nr:hypothetical protein [Candidatus Kaiserbacteria bacterium]
MWPFTMLQLLQTMKSLYISKRVNFLGTISVLLLLFPTLTFAISYTPGQTLDPSCSPSDPTCLVINTNVVADNFTATSTTATSSFAGGFNVANGGLLYDRSTGNVGIGTSSPLYALSVRGDGLFSGALHFATTSTIVYQGTSTVFSTYADPTASGLNTFVGLNAGNLTLGPASGPSYLGSLNTALGAYALNAATTVCCSVAIGGSALNADTTGSNNTALGYAALALNTTGGNNTAVGIQSLYNNATGTENTAIGLYSLLANLNGNQNTAVGFSLIGNTSGSGNSGLGYRSLYSNTTGAGNTAVGYFGLTSNTTGNNNTAIGFNANVGATNLTNATAIGYSATVSASSSLVLGGTGANAVKVGIGTTSPWGLLSVVAAANSSAPQFVVASTTAVSFMVDQSGNVGIGTSSPISRLTVSGSNPTNTYFVNGSGAAFAPLSLDAANFSVAPSSGIYATHVYDTQLTYTSNTGSFNYGIYNNVSDPTTVTANVPSMIGVGNFVKHSGTGIVANNLQAAQNQAVNSSPTTVAVVVGSNNIAQNGTTAGATTTTLAGSYNSVTANSPFGLVSSAYGARVLLANSNANSTITNLYGFAADSLSNTGTIGSTYGVYVGNVTAGTQTNHPYSFYALDTSAWNYFGGAVGIGTSTPTAQLSTTGTVRFSNFGAGTLTTDASGNLSVSSDERLKNIDGSFTRGLSDIMKLSPISYHWNQISGLDTTTSYSGFSAQNVQTAIPEAVGTSGNGYLTLQDRPILAATVNAIKDIGSIGGTYKDNLTAFLQGWLGSSNNNLSTVSAHTIQADQVCIKTSSGNPVCLTGDQLQQIIQNQNGVGGSAPINTDTTYIVPNSTSTPPADILPIDATSTP